MNTEEITKLTLDAWDEVQDKPEASVEAEEPDETAETLPEESDADAEERESEPAEDEAETEPEAEAEEEDEEQAEPEEEEEVTAAYTSNNERVKAFLSKYGDDPEKALAAAAHLELVLGRQSQEMAALRQQAEDAEQEAQQLRTFGPGAVLTPEQREWAGQAVESDNPAVYVQQALQAGEFALARAVCDQWSEESPYEAARAAQVVDAVEWQSSQQQQSVEPVQLDQGALMSAITDIFPDMPEYEQQMVSTLSSLGDGHPLVHDARSNDPETAARGIIGIYEIARAQSASVKTTRAKLKSADRQAADEARTRAVVSSAQATSKPPEAPRQREIMPGLTMEALDEAWGSKR